MNDSDFEKLACENPWNDDPAFLAAGAASSELTQLLARMQSRDELLQSGFQAEPPPGLKEKLLAIPGQHAISETHETGRQAPWQWQKILPLAASLVLAIVVSFTLLPRSANEAVASEVLAHIHAELAFLDSDASISRDQLDEHLTDYGGSFNNSMPADLMQESGFMECWIEKEQATHFHMVYAGEQGTVTVIIMNGDAVDGPLALDDARFDGMILPTPAGNLVVAGEKGEPVEDIAQILVAGIDW